VFKHMQLSTILSQLHRFHVGSWVEWRYRDFIYERLTGSKSNSIVFIFHLFLYTLSKLTTLQLLCIWNSIALHWPSAIQFNQTLNALKRHSAITIQIVHCLSFPWNHASLNLLKNDLSVAVNAVPLLPVESRL